MKPSLLSSVQRKEKNSGHMPGPVLGTLHNPYFILPNIPRERYYYSQVIAEDSEALRA